MILWTGQEINQSWSFSQNFVYLFCDSKQTAALVIILLVRPKYSEPQTAKKSADVVILQKLPEMALVTSENRLSHLRPFHEEER